MGALFDQLWTGLAEATSWVNWDAVGTILVAATLMFAIREATRASRQQSLRNAAVLEAFRRAAVEMRYVAARAIEGRTRDERRDNARYGAKALQGEISKVRHFALMDFPTRHSMENYIAVRDLGPSLREALLDLGADADDPEGEAPSPKVARLRRRVEKGRLELAESYIKLLDYVIEMLEIEADTFSRPSLLERLRGWRPPWRPSRRSDATVPPGPAGGDGQF